MTIFIDPNETIKIKIYVVEKDGADYASPEAKYLTDYETITEGKSNIQEYEVVFRKPTYKDSVDITKKAISSDGESFSIDPVTLKYERLAVLLKDWSFVDATGEKVPVTRGNINKLSPVVAETIAEELERVLFPA